MTWDVHPSSPVADPCGCDESDHRHAPWCSVDDLRVEAIAKLPLAREKEVVVEGRGRRSIGWDEIKTRTELGPKKG